MRITDIRLAPPFPSWLTLKQRLFGKGEAVKYEDDYITIISYRFWRLEVTVKRNKNWWTL